MVFACPYPYAAKAIIEFDWVPNTLSVWLTFRHPMDTSVNPAIGKLTVKLNGAPTPPFVNAWLDTFTLLLSRAYGGPTPTTISVTFSGPTPNLRTTWGKQWEPWTDIEAMYLRANRGRTADGGFATQYTNKTGAPTVKGNVVCSDPANADSVVLCAANSLNPSGIFVDSGIADGSLVWTAVAGRALVWMDGGGCAQGDRIITSAVPGRGLVNNTPAVAAHFQEIGHALQTVGANGLAACDVHFL